MTLCARDAYEKDGPERAKLITQIRALLPLIEHLKGEITFKALYDALNGPTLKYSGSCAQDAKWARKIRNEAQAKGITIDEWEQLRVAPSEEKNANEALRQFILDNKEALGGHFVREKFGKRTRYTWRPL
ncbi:hypothetical protein [Desulfovibrio sp.]|uniref:hypothetical protein n=1 Tax=Desulfovibrio sp. TaxID=885 RepID=UPI0023C1143A|nr:hypothetical protein [Desulfovibrio sp.]MDE7241477.1 hypothetical protein [Desulfovibrio sp.]